MRCSKMNAAHHRWHHGPAELYSSFGGGRFCERRKKRPSRFFPSQACLWVLLGTDAVSWTKAGPEQGRFGTSCLSGAGRLQYRLAL